MELFRGLAWPVIMIKPYTYRTVVLGTYGTSWTVPTVLRDVVNLGGT